MGVGLFLHLRTPAGCRVVLSATKRVLSHTHTHTHTHMCICMYVYVSMYACTYVFMQVCIHACMCVCSHMQEHARTCKNMFTRKNVFQYSRKKQQNTETCGTIQNQTRRASMCHKPRVHTDRLLSHSLRSLPRGNAAEVLAESGGWGV